MLGGTISAKKIVDISSKVDTVDHRSGLWLVTAADSEYFCQYAPALIESCIQNGTKLWMVVANPSDKCKNLLNYVQLAEFRKLDINVATTMVPYTPEPAWYATLRFDFARELLQWRCVDRCLIIDVDSYLRRPIPQFAEFNLGLWLRENEKEPGMQLLAGCSLFSQSTLPMLETMMAEVGRLGYYQHFVDQLALYKAYQQWRGDKFINFAKWGPLIDWDFTEQGYIWTGKGPRKHENLLYITEQNKLTSDFIDRAQTYGYTI